MEKFHLIDSVNHIVFYIDFLSFDLIAFLIGCIFIFISFFGKSEKQINDVVLHTNFGIDECKDRLNRSIDIKSSAFSDVLNPISLFLGKDQKQIRGKLNGNNIELGKRRYYENSFAPIFLGSFIEDNTSTAAEIRGKFDILLIIKIFTYISIVLLILIFLFVLFLVIQDINSGSVISISHLIGLVHMTTMLVLIVGITMFGKWLGNRDKKYILEFLEKTLDTKVEYQNNQDVLAK